MKALAIIGLCAALIVTAVSVAAVSVAGVAVASPFGNSQGFFNNLKSATPAAASNGASQVKKQGSQNRGYQRAASTVPTAAPSRNYGYRGQAGATTNEAQNQAMHDAMKNMGGFGH